MGVRVQQDAKEEEYMRKWEKTPKAVVRRKKNDDKRLSDPKTVERRNDSECYKTEDRRPSRTPATSRALHGNTEELLSNTEDTQAQLSHETLRQISRQT